MDNNPFTYELGVVLLKFQILLSADELCLDADFKHKLHLFFLYFVKKLALLNKTDVLTCILTHKVATTSIDCES